ncbi:probable serine/threonine-protein kinase PBL4 isoform X1 [Selaginella moellendorffii]|uniref:probable serine/threonine-protein kinase PBL4 isoform X1 n=1 Tax=Selaginella moellendorffii TaxID=88036 RepID=UPI000D1C989C|nr:probable serine/threonine-protein kinase PBL4 isoform X1 [Selaginella moellendorffii]|eukprot:XP_024531116.1 probable serine/threonine-protein kinase PBL4 isoform X1 [Selaginella moellendorffii]
MKCRFSLENSSAPSMPVPCRQISICRMRRDESSLRMGFLSLLRSRKSGFVLEGDESSSARSSGSVAPSTELEGAAYVCSACKTRSFRSSGRPLKVFFSDELKAATNDFGFCNYMADAEGGHVFRGVLEGGEVVAVRVISDASVFQSRKQLLGRIRSPNIVRLVGYCDEGDDRKFLVYDFICNGSLEWHLTVLTRNAMGWSIRKSIAVGIAKGLLYLHSYSIVHRNLRSRNVLLTHDYTPVITGMGYAKHKTQPAFPSPPCVTGYSAPEHFRGHAVDEKNDIFSYGVILLELITSRKAMEDSSQRLLTEWASPLLRDFDRQKLVDPELGCDDNNTYELVTMMSIASLCLNEDPLERPSASKILSLLEEDCDGEVFSSDDDLSTLSQASSSLTHRAEKKVTWNACSPVRRGPSRRLSYNVMLS